MPDFQKPIPIQHRYLHIPVRNGNPRVVMHILCEGRIQREFNVELPRDEAPDWWAFYDVSAFHGQAISLQTASEYPPQYATQLEAAIQHSDHLIGEETLYQEAQRPQLHFTSRRGWNNDPNGLVFCQGTWHMYYQHNPFGVGWGNMHWGHAASPDLVHWQELPIALYQRSLKDMAFSGGGFVDPGNSAGFKQAGSDPHQDAIVAAFTSTGRGECLAASFDGGLTFTEWDDNPILTHQGRDPKIIWYAPGNKWVMIIYEETQSERGYALYSSQDLRQWQRTDFLPGYFECPELFEIPVDGEPGKTRWVIHGALWQGAKSVYLIGSFDGEQFHPEGEPQPAHFGPNFYAAQLFSNAPQKRCILVGWLQGAAYPGMPFSQGMTVPLELCLRRFSSGLRLCFLPVPELNTLRGEAQHGAQLTTQLANQLLEGAADELLEVQIELQPDGSQPVRLDVRGHPVVYDPQRHTITFAGMTAPLAPGRQELALRVLVDRGVTEVFADDGYAAFAAMTIAPFRGAPIRLEGAAQVHSLTIYPLRSIWD